MTEFEILGVTEQSTQAEVKKAYKKLAQRFHPDKTNDNGEKFRIIKAAYDLIMKQWGVKKAPKAKPAEPPETKWGNGPFWSKPAEPAPGYFHQINISFSDLFGKSTIQIPGTFYYVKVPYGVTDRARHSRVLAKSLDGSKLEYFNIEYHVSDPRGFYSQQIINSTKHLYCKVKVTAAMVLGEFEMSLKNIHPDMGDFTFPLSTSKLIIVPHVGLPGPHGTRGNLYVEPIIELKSLDEEIYPVILQLQKKAKEKIDASVSKHFR